MGVEGQGFLALGAGKLAFGALRPPLSRSWDLGRGRESSGSGKKGRSGPGQEARGRNKAEGTKKHRKQGKSETECTEIRAKTRQKAQKTG